MHNLIARFIEPVCLLLGLRRRVLPAELSTPRANCLPARIGPRRLLVCRSTMPKSMVPRPPNGPYSQAAYDRWERAEIRMRREEAALWLVLHGIDPGPAPFTGR
ncbi:hypothetical protein AMK09_23065 [Streptomyces sp. CB02488]|nr:hypothetical protein AMK09_23065 [Streptomyces sp. CB02488]